jgi:hypothetical protein
MKHLKKFNENVKDYIDNGEASEYGNVPSREDEYKEISKKVWSNPRTPGINLESLAEYCMKRAKEEGKVFIINDDGYRIQKMYKSDLGNFLFFEGEFFKIIMDPKDDRVYDGGDYYGDWIVTKISKEDITSGLKSKIDTLQVKIDEINKL